MRKRQEQNQQRQNRAFKEVLSEKVGQTITIPQHEHKEMRKINDNRTREQEKYTDIIANRFKLA